MKRTLVVAIGLGVVLLVAVALAYSTWYCPVPGCGVAGKAYYYCSYCDRYWNQPAETYGLPGPPPKQDTCGRSCNAYGAACYNHHNYYPPLWQGYNGK